MTKEEKIDRLIKWETETLGVDLESALDYVLRFGHLGWETQDETELDEAIQWAKEEGYDL